MKKRIIATVVLATMLVSSAATIAAENPADSTSEIPDTETVEQEDSVDAFTANLYSSFLGRTAADSEIAYWSDQLRNIQIDGVNAVLGFYYSQEYQGRLEIISDAEYVQGLYQGILLRGAGDSEIQYWCDNIANGYDKLQILAGFLNSVEFQNNCAAAGFEAGSYNPTPAPTDRESQVKEFVARFYVKVLGRYGADEELTDWARKLMAEEISGYQLACGFINSPELTARNLSDEAYIQTLYRSILGRDADEVGLADWVSQLQNGTSRSSLIMGFCGSAEFIALCDSYEIEPLRIVKYPMARAKLDELGITTLEAAFNWCVMPYVRNNDWTSPSLGNDFYAQIGFSTHSGNCYVMAATFQQMAVELGYEAHQVGGMVPRAGGGITPHSWVEVVIDGRIYVCDPDFTLYGSSGYMIHYGQSGTWVYSDYSRMN